MRSAKLILVGVFVALSIAHPAEASFLDDIKARITDRANQIKQLDEEIGHFKQQLTKTQATKQTLQSELNTLDSTAKQLTGDLTKAERNLKKTDTTIIQLNNEIRTKSQEIAARRSGVVTAIRALNDLDDQSLIEVMAEKSTLSDFLSDTHTISTLQETLTNEISLLLNDTETLANKKRSEEEAKIALAKLKTEIADKKQLVVQNKDTKAQLLSATQSQEAAYQAQLADRLAKRQQFEAELRSIEAQLRVTINPKTLPQTGTKTLLWPLDAVIITQNFGNTAFAAQHAQVYNGNGHNGIDLGAKVGTPLKSAAAGVVKGVGDTDNTCRGASYGKWILIEHNNGLSTLYAHLSMIKVGEGQTVSAGELIGYTGNTGYSTGPHLHFTVYASQGVKVDSLQSKVPGCGVYRLPIASHNSYLNPRNYLP